MDLVAIKRPDRERCDRLRFVRGDGSTDEIEMPRQGVLAHDLVHFVVESGLRRSDGFLGLVAAGSSPGFALAMAETVGQGANQVEAIVEALQTQLWSGRFDGEAFAYGVETAAQARGAAVPGPDELGDPAAFYERAIALQAEWSALKPYESLVLRLAGDGG